MDLKLLFGYEWREGRIRILSSVPGFCAAWKELESGTEMFVAADAENRCVNKRNRTYWKRMERLETELEPYFTPDVLWLPTCLSKCILSFQQLIYSCTTLGPEKPQHQAETLAMGGLYQNYVLKLSGTVTVWTGKSCRRRRLPSGW